jgi:hypothetical protein
MRLKEIKHSGLHLAQSKVGKGDSLMAFYTLHQLKKACDISLCIKVLPIARSLLHSFDIFLFPLFFFSFLKVSIRNPFLFCFRLRPLQILNLLPYHRNVYFLNHKFLIF